VRIVEILRRYSLRDLLPYACTQFCDRVDLLLSSFVFRLTCCWHGVQLSRACRIWGRVKMRRFPGSQIRIGNEFYLVNRPGRYAFNIFPQTLMRTYSSSARIDIGDGVGANSMAIFCRSQTIRIGARTMIGGNCQIMDSDGHPLWPLTARWHYPGNEHDAPVYIGEDVYIGLNVIVLKGSRIGNGAVIAAGSVVSGDIPPNCVAGGIPARVITQLDK
jgi:acetyltransferase-like isoleucine patch superfamily enzyme